MPVCLRKKRVWLVSSKEDNYEYLGLDDNKNEVNKQQNAGEMYMYLINYLKFYQLL